MALKGCGACVKCLVIALTFIIWFVGCCLLVSGVWIVADDRIVTMLENVNHPGTKAVFVVAYIFITIGAILVIGGICGCCGAIRESHGMMVFLFSCLSVVFCFLFVLGIWNFIMIKNAQAKVKYYTVETLYTSVQSYYDDEAARRIMDNLQTQLKCCGSDHGLEDYKFAQKNGSKPESCEPGTENKPCMERMIYYLDVYHKVQVITSSVILGLSLVMLLAIVFSVTLCCLIKRSTNHQIIAV